MAHLRDRRAFGNIGTRKFRGARFGDPLSPRGPQYTKEGRVLDYSTDVGPFTIIDQSGEGNTATLYSGRGLTMDGVSDLIDFGSPTFSEPVTSVTGYARSTDTSINLGLASATLAGNDTWETFSADTAAKDYGDAQWFNGTDTYVIKNIAGFRSSDSSGSIEATFITTATTTSTLFASCYTLNDSNRLQFQVDSSGRVALITRAGAFNAIRTLASFNDGQQHTAKLTSSGTSWQIEVDGAVEAIEVFAGANNGWWFSDIPLRNNITVGASLYDTAVAFADASISEVIVSDGTSTPVLRYTGRGATPWVDTIGTNNGTVSGVDQTVTEYFTNPDFILGTGYNGDLSDIRCLGATGTVLGHWSLADWSNPTGDTSNGKTIVDSGPNQLHGVCTGCSGFTGEGIDPDVAGIVGLDDAQWFNGTDTYVALGTLASISTYTEILISLSFIATGGSSRIFSMQHSGVDDLRINFDASGNLKVAVDDGTAYTLDFGAGYNDGNVHSITMTLDGSGLSATVDGSTTMTDAGATFNFSTAAGIAAIASNAGNLGTNLMTGSVFGLSISNQSGVQHSYTGLGNDPWKDTIGSNNGTEAGTFTRELVTASDANDQIDALGNAILEPRLNTQQLNLFGEGEYSSTPGSASLDLTTTATWEVWGNFYGAAPASTQAILSKTRFSGNERTVDITKSSATADNTVNFTATANGFGATIFSKTLTVTDKLSHIAFTYDGATQTMVGYIDGVLTAFSATSGTIQTSLFVNTQPYMIGARPSVDPASSFAPFKIGSTKIYNVVLTADEVLTNYNTQKSLYGL